MYEDDNLTNFTHDAMAVEPVVDANDTVGTMTDEPVDEAPEQELINVEISQLKDQLLRALAETDNIRRRGEREREEASRYAITKFARDLLSVSDNLSRALETIVQNTTEQPDFITNFIEGIKLTERELQNTYERFGVKKVAPLGEKFDHNFHQAMMEIESADAEVGTVLQVLQVGYVMHDRLLRPAMVGVAKAAS